MKICTNERYINNKCIFKNIFINFLSVTIKYIYSLNLFNNINAIFLIAIVSHIIKII